MELCEEGKDVVPHAVRQFILPQLMSQLNENLRHTTRMIQQNTSLHFLIENVCQPIQADTLSLARWKSICDSIEIELNASEERKKTNNQRAKFLLFDCTVVRLLMMIEQYGLDQSQRAQLRQLSSALGL